MVVDLYMDVHLDATNTPPPKKKKNHKKESKKKSADEALEIEAQ